MARSQFDKALQEIEKYFDQSPVKAFTEKILQHIYLSKKQSWNITHKQTTTGFISYLKKKELFAPFDFVAEDGHLKTVYSWKVEDDYSIISGLKNNSYFSHRTAMFLNRFIEIEPEIIYLNHEHKVQENDLSNILNQIAIDRAFSVDQRIVTSYYSFKNYKIQILNGKGTNNLGVIKEKGKFFEYTDAERTLIDIAVRPAYAGGVSAVLEAFKQTKERIDIKKLALYLHKMNFIYPYHQVIGFYLEKAGYNESSLELFEKRMDYKFFLTYNIRNKLFSKRWQLYYPKELIV